MTTKEQIADWKARLNDLHVEIQIYVDLEWNHSITPDKNGVRPIDSQSMQQKESLTHKRHVLTYLESCVDHLNEIE